MRQQASRTKPTNDEAAPWPSAFCSDGAKGLPRERTLEFNTPSRRQRTRTRSQCQHLARISEGKGTNVKAKSESCVAIHLLCATATHNEGVTIIGMRRRRTTTFAIRRLEKSVLLAATSHSRKISSRSLLHHFMSCTPLTSSSESQTYVTFRRCQGLADQRWPTAFLLVPHS